MGSQITSQSQEGMGSCSHPGLSTQGKEICSSGHVMGLLWMALLLCPWLLVTQLVTSGFLYFCRVFAPKCASCARPILPAQVGSIHLEMIRCLAQPGLCLVLSRSAPALGPLWEGGADAPAPYPSGLRDVCGVHDAGGRVPA